RVLVLPGVDLEEEVARLDHRALLVVLRDEVSGDPGADLCGYETDGSAHPLAVNGHIFLYDRSDLDGLRGSDSRLRSLLASRRRNHDGRDQEGASTHAHRAHAGRSVLHAVGPEKRKILRG